MFKGSIAKENPPKWKIRHGRQNNVGSNWNFNVESNGNFNRSVLAGISRKSTFNLKQVQELTLADDLSRAIVGHLGLLSFRSRSEQIRNLLCFNKILPKQWIPASG